MKKDKDDHSFLIDEYNHLDNLLIKINKFDQRED